MTKIEKFTHGIPFSIEVERIEEELSRLWKTAADAVEGEREAPITRAASLNLVIYSERHDGAENYPRVLSELTEEVPCRVILLLAEPHAPKSSVDAWISTYCLPQRDAKQVCSEQITMLVQGTLVQTISTEVLSFLIPDLPVVLWWDAAILQRKDLFARFARSVDHVVFDSASIRSVVEARELHTLLHSWSAHVSFGDLSWTRLAPWQSLTAQFFDVGHCRAMLATLDAINVTYESGSDLEVNGFLQAFLYVGWLASRLRWQEEFRPKQVSSSKWEWQFTHEKGKVRVQLEARPVHDERADEILEISLHAQKPEGYAILNRFDAAGEVQASLSVQGMKSVKRMLRLRRSSEAELLGTELDFLSSHPLYLNALQCIGG